MRTIVRTSRLFPIVIFAAAVLALYAGASSGASGPSERADDSNRPATLLREGDKVEFQGVFRIAGERVVFQPIADQEAPAAVLRVLENLALERIVAILEEPSGERLWSVRGEVTEYQGNNYLLVHRSVVESGTKTDDRR